MDYTNILTILKQRGLFGQDAETLAERLSRIDSEKLTEKGLNLVISGAIEDYKRNGLEATLEALESWE